MPMPSSIGTISFGCANAWRRELQDGADIFSIPRWIDNTASRTQTDAYAPFIEFMLNHYYDPMYDYQISGKADRIVFSGDAASVQDLSSADESRSGAA